jgi:two-component system chemotaxis sensor kinase CheA
MTDEMDEIWALYVDDGGQALDAVEEALESLAKAAGDPAADIGALFRAVHTFKGNSRVLGLAHVESLAHLAEDLIGLVRDAGVPYDADIGAILLRTGDMLRGMLDETADTRQDVAADAAADLKDDLRQMIARLTAPEEAAPPPPPAKAKKAAAPKPEPEPEAEAEPEPAPTPAPKPLDLALSGLLDQLDGGDGADFDDFLGEEDEVADTPPEDPMPVDEPEPVAPPQAAVLAEVTDGRLQTIDPAYRKIFAEMVQDTCAGIDAACADWTAESADKLTRLAQNLRFAADRMQLDTWCAVIDDFLAGAIASDSAAAFRDALRAMAVQDLDAATPAPTQPDSAPDGRAFFAAMADIYPQIADQSHRLRGEDAPDAAERQALCDQITALAAPLGYVRLIDAAERLTAAQIGHGHAAAELAFYEELVHIEWAQPAAIFDADVVAPSKMLGAWCRDHVFATLQELRLGLEDRDAAKGAAWFPKFETLMRRVHFACLAYDIDTASQLTMALVDLFARIRVDDKAPDVILLQMARGFVDTMELVFDALDQGDTPDTSRIEKMFEDATSVCFVASGMVTAKTIETRLGLPPEFHRVLSPESVKAASDAMDEGLQFYVLRADLNEDDALAQGFLECITSGLVRMITNVTVFLDQRTLFDFLVASSLPTDRMVEQLALLDPAGKRLSVVHILEQRAQPAADLPHDALDAVQLTRPADNTNLLESVGAISASHALMEHDLAKLAASDLMQEIETALHRAGLPALDMKLGAILRDKLDSHSQRLRQISESGAQLSAELTYLQQESVAQRSHPAEILLRALGAFVAAEAKKIGADARLTHVGGQITLDLQLIEELRQILKALVLTRLRAAHPPTRFHVSIEAESDHIRVEVSDNSPTDLGGADMAALDKLTADRKGKLRKVVLPAAGGLRFHLSLPQKMIVLDGMVVRCGDVRYVLPVDAIQRILQTDQIVAVSAGGRQMLKPDEGGLVPIRALRGQGLTVVPGQQLFVIIQTNGARFAVPVDELLGQQLVLLRPLEGVLSSLRDMSGVAILSGGEIGLVVSVSALAPEAGKDAA